jgi:Rps23 Pro-64 3,4-dihydroxylase Tpa1-like proline 4-hydroxylase
MEARRLTIDNRLLLIYDNFDLNEINVLEDYVKNQAPFRSIQSDSEESLNTVGSYWTNYLDLEKFKTTEFFKTLLEIVQTEFNLIDVAVDVTYINSLQYGDTSFSHKDANHINVEGKNKTITSILYLNKEWKDEWQGETLFYDDEIAYAVLPKFGRLVVFDGEIKHSARPPSRICFEKRINHIVKIVGTAL